MKIGFDAKRYFHNRTGLGNYSRDLVDTLIRLYPSDRYFLYDTHPATLDLPANTIAAVPRGRKLLWRSFGMMQDIRLHGLDVYHGLSNELPRGSWPSDTRKIVSIHDVIFRTHPEHYPFPDRCLYHLKTAHAVKVADRVVATSQATADELLQYYRVNPDKIRVVYQTCGLLHWKSYTRDAVQEFRVRQRLPADFILYVSSFQPRKNHIQLLRALKEVKSSDIYLVLAGKPGPSLDACKAFIEDNNLKSSVSLLNDVMNAELPLLYRAASGFVYPSMTEGFGIPLLEAACAGLPMAVSDIAVFRELAPEGSLYFSPERVDEIGSALKMLSQLSVSDHSLYLEKFRPETTAGQMHALYRECVDGTIS